MEQGFACLWKVGDGIPRKEEGNRCGNLLRPGARLTAPFEYGFLMLGLEATMLILSDPPPWPQLIGPETRHLAQARPIRLPPPPALSPESF